MSISCFVCDCVNVVISFLFSRYCLLDKFRILFIKLFCTYNKKQTFHTLINIYYLLTDELTRLHQLSRRSPAEKIGNMEAMDIQAVESKLSDVTVTAIPMNGKNNHKDISLGGNSHATISTVSASSPSSTGKDKDNGMSKYAQLLAVIEEMGKEVRPSYSGSRSSAERLKRGIVHARILVRECLIETERSARQ